MREKNDADTEDGICLDATIIALYILYRTIH